MLKPSSTSNLDQDYVEYYPHLLFLHNKAEIYDFMPDTLQTMTVIHSNISFVILPYINFFSF